MIDIAALRLGAEVTSILAFITGVFACTAAYDAAWHLKKDVFGGILDTTGMFLMVLCIGLASIASSYFLVNANGTEAIQGVVLALWYIMMLVAFIISMHSSGLAIGFGKSIRKIDEVIAKRGRK